MARPRRFYSICIPALLSGLCLVQTGCQCSFNCTPTFKGPNCGPNGCGGGYGGQNCGYGGQNCNNGPAGAGQWAQTGRDASQQPGQWGQGCNAPPNPNMGYAPMGYAAPQNYQPAMQPQQQQMPVQLGPTPIPERAPDRMPNAQGNNNMTIPYPGTLTNGPYMQQGGGQTPFSQGVQGVPFGPTPNTQQGNPNMQNPISRPARQGDGNEMTLPAPRIMPTEAPYSP